MINTQLHNQLIDIEIQRKAIEAKKRVQEAKTEVLKERLRQALYIVGFLFIVSSLFLILLRFLPHGSFNKCPSLVKTSKTITKEGGNTHKENPNKNLNQKRSSQNAKKLFNGIEYVKENNLIYKRIYKDGELIKEEPLAPTIKESKEIKHEKIPQFSTAKRTNASK